MRYGSTQVITGEKYVATWSTPGMYRLFNTDQLEKTRFPFHLPHHEASRPDEVGVDQRKSDDDGDLDIIRRPQSINDVLILEHKMATPLAQVGLQVWTASLYLADYIIDSYLRFQNKVVIELGAGIGLCSIVAGMFAECVVCTDLNKHGILELCHKNLSNNKNCVNGDVIVAELNWTTFEGRDLMSFCGCNDITHLLKHLDIIIAADVIYDDVLTRELLSCISKLMGVSEQKIDVFVAVEKRVNFSLEALEAVSPYYDYFVSCVTTHSKETGLVGVRIEEPHRQYFQYDRTPQLEIWHLTNTTLGKDDSEATKMD